MKKLIALILSLTLVLAFLPSCGAINKNEVAVLWSDYNDEYLFTIADAFDRAAYIENIKYSHYDAEKDGSKQLQQAKDALTANADALVVSATDAITATAILKEAKDAGKPIVFLCNDALVEVAIDTALALSAYDKCVVVNVESTSLVTVLAKKIAKDLVDNYADYDRDGNGKISCVNFGLSALIASAVNTELKEAGKEELSVSLENTARPTTDIASTIDAIFGEWTGAKGNEKIATPVELILTDDDAYVAELLLALRKYELNHNKLVTHFIPLYTVGIEANAGILLSENAKEEEKAAHSIMNEIDSGHLSAAALVNDDEIALSAGAILRNFIKGNEIFKGVNAEYVDGYKVLVPYTIY